MGIDVFGPLDSLNMLGRERTISLSIIAATLDPVSTRPPNVNDTRSPLFAERVVPTHTFENAPGDLEVLIVPGGTFSPNLQSLGIMSDVDDVFPRPRHMLLREYDPHPRFPQENGTDPPLPPHRLHRLGGSCANRSPRSEARDD